MQRIARDLGSTLKTRIHIDASAALGMCQRRGLGEVGHLDVADLWAQEKVRSGTVEIGKVLRGENPGSVLTKHIDQQA